MIYLDTSFLTPLFREDSTSAKVAAFISRQAIATMSISKLSPIEFTSLISRDVRLGLLTANQGKQLISAFNSTVSTALEVIIPNSHDFDLAQEYVAIFPTQLRGPDALHLAIAHNNNVEFIATLDDAMLFAAKKLNIPARRAIR